MTLANVESLGAIVVAQLKEAKRTQDKAFVTGIEFLLRAQELPDIGQPQIYFDIIKSLETL